MKCESKLIEGVNYIRVEAKGGEYDIHHIDVHYEMTLFAALWHGLLKVVLFRARE